MYHIFIYFFHKCPSNLNPRNATRFSTAFNTLLGYFLCSIDWIEVKWNNKKKNIVTGSLLFRSIFHFRLFLFVVFLFVWLWGFSFVYNLFCHVSKIANLWVFDESFCALCPLGSVPLFFLSLFYFFFLFFFCPPLLLLLFVFIWVRGSRTKRAKGKGEKGQWSMFFFGEIQTEPRGRGQGEAEVCVCVLFDFWLNSHASKRKLQKKKERNNHMECFPKIIINNTVFCFFFFELVWFLKLPVPRCYIYFFY